jgi:hypothetical protein
MDVSELCDKERVALREELHNLKNCQVTFLTLSITVTGVILGVATSLIQAPFLGIASLFPLIVLFPSWWVFFDKATTITRIVGYYRILEKLILGHYKANNFMGWENALGEFRKRQQADPLNLPYKQWPHGLRNILLLRTPHQYWVISYYTFFALSALCVVLSTVLLKGSWYLIFSVLGALLFIMTSWRNMRTVWNLIEGRNSYDCNEHFWKQILEVSKVSPLSVDRKHNGC